MTHTHRSSHIWGTLAATAALLCPTSNAQGFGSGGGFVSDDFNSCAGLPAHWSLVDPVGDATFEVLGAGSADAHLSISVPAGTAHDAYDVNLAPRVMQVVADEDFELEVKFESEPTQRYQIQGVLIEQDAGNWLRFDFVGRNGRIRIYAGMTVNGDTQTMMNRRIASGASGQPLWLRVQREGDRFIQSYSRDGVNFLTAADFTAVMAVTGAGVFAGNAGTNPAFSGVCDYIFETASPIDPEDGASPGQYVVNATTIGSGSISLDPDQPSYGCGEEVTVTASPQSGWRFDHWEQGLSGTSNPQVLSVNGDVDLRAVFVVDSGPPLISEVEVDAGAHQATVTWTTDEPATSQVDFGPDANYGQQVLSSELVLNHELVLTGLDAESIYHFQVTSTDSVGLTSSTPDDNFVTSLVEGVVSDDFNSCSGLSSIWTALDPLADSTIALTGVGTQDARLEIDVPGGLRHDLTGDVLAPRVMQVVDDADFQIVAKFDSVPSQKYQLQGILVEQGPGDWLRFDFHHNGRRLKHYAAVTVGGATTTLHNRGYRYPGTSLFMRVTRSGSTWWMEYSNDGLDWDLATTFQHDLQVSQVGVYVGNGGNNPPAYTGLVDFFFNAGTPIVPEDGQVSGGPFDLTTNVQGQGTISLDPPGPTYSCGSLVSVLATPSSGWQFDHWEGAASGSSNPVIVSMDQHQAVVGFFVEVQIPPTITNVNVVPGAAGAQVTWTTDQPATSQVDFGLDPGYGSTVSNPALVTQHSLELSGLVPDTLYHFQITSANGSGQASSTPDDVFTTVAASIIQSDDFSNCSGLAGIWTWIDPLGDSTMQLVGAGTQDARLQIDVPGGSAHDPFDINNAPRIVQAANDVDFELEVKFEALLTSGFQIQGLLVEQDALEWLRFDFYATNSQVRFYVGDTVGGSTSTVSDTALGQQTTPLWLRVQRVGDLFTVLWSNDGTNYTQLTQFTRVMAVQTVGVYAGNDGNPAPAFTGLVDYIFDTANPIVPEDGSGGGGPYTLVTEVIGQGAVIQSPDQPDYACGDHVSLTPVPVAGWRFDHWELDLGGIDNPAQVVMNGDKNVRAVFSFDQQPPTVSNVVVTPGATTANVSWTTDEPATSRVDYGLDSSYGSHVESSAYVLNHSIDLSLLTPGSTYHFQVTSVDQVGFSTSTTDDVFDTNPLATVPKDDFNDQNLDLSNWTLVDGMGDSTLEMAGVGTADAHLRLGVPAAIVHDPFDFADDAVRLRQPVADEDFDVVLKWESPLDQKFQIQGLIVEEDALNYVRFDLHFDGNNLKAFASRTLNGSGLSQGNVTAAAGPWPGGPLYQRIVRAADDWTYYTSFDGLAWTLAAGPFTVALDVAAMGPFAGNAGNNPPAHTGVLDWIASFDDPIVGEDQGSPADDQPPYLYRVEEGLVGDTTTRIDWFTDESAIGYVEYGLTTAYELGATQMVGPAWDPTVLLTNLTPETTYHYRVVSEDALFQQTVSGDFSFTTNPDGGGSNVPVFDIWYGTPDGGTDVRQRFGHLGKAQTWVNVQGDVFDPNGSVVSLEYTLNGGGSNFLNFGPNNTRLPGMGDFNIELDWADLLPGDNVVVITATDNDAGTSQQTVIVEYTDNVVWPDTYSVDFTSSTDLLEIVQPVDGKFEIVGSDLHVEEWGYDRLFATGDLQHDDYEVTVEVTVSSLHPDGYDSPSNGPAIGMGMRWIGHTGSQQPRLGFWPTGAFTWFRWTTANQRWQIRTNNYSNTVSDPDTFEFNVPYVLKAQVETLAGNVPQYRFRYWKASESEPSTWNLELQGDPADPQNGGILFLAHECDATFGAISVIPLGN